MQTIFFKQLLYKYLIENYHIDFSQIDCFSILMCAIDEKIEGFLYKKIYDNVQLKDIPKVIRKQLYLNYVYNLDKNKLYLSELNKLQSDLQSENISFLPEKGMYLISNVYKDIAVRYMEDIDLIAKLQDFKRIQKVLESNDYTIDLINDKELSLYSEHVPVKSCLYIKKKNLIFPIPFVKIDISFIEDEDFYFHNNTIENFLQLCKYTYNSIKIKNPPNCKLNKLFDIIYFIQHYPGIKNNVLENNIYTKLPEINYIKNCIDYYEASHIGREIYDCR